VAKVFRSVVLVVIILTISSLGVSRQVLAGQSSASDLGCDTLYPLMNGFLAQHLTYKKFTPELEQRVTNQFVKNLDPSKLYLLDGDVKKIKADMADLFSKISSKNKTRLFESAV